MKELLDLWKERLGRFQERPEVALGMDANVAMGVQHGRIVALKQCIEELEKKINEQQPASAQ